MAATAGDIIQGALLSINSYSPGVALNAQDATVGLATLNDLLDSLSTDKCFVFTQTDNTFQWQAGKYQYSVGNYAGGTFAGTLTAGSAIITGVTVPSTLVVGGTLTDLQALVPAGTTVLSIGANTVTMTANATSNSIGLDVISYTIPGDIPIPRPLRFNNGFTRANTSGNANLDYAFEFVSLDRYKEELLKNVQGPWPYIAAYQPTFPLGTLYVYPSPGANYTAHLFTDLILSQFSSVTSPYSLPQGYTRALKKLLALELAPVYGKTPHPHLVLQAREAKELLKSLNDSPVVTLKYDSAISRSQTADAGWIAKGGFY
jgi:hypothetical protein